MSIVHDAQQNLLSWPRNLQSQDHIMRKIKPEKIMDIAFSISTPKPIGDTQIPIEDVIKAFTEDDSDFPIRLFSKELNKWEIVDGVKNIVKVGNTNRILWLQCTYTPITIIKLFAQAGWHIDLYHWHEYIDLSNVSY